MLRRLFRTTVWLGLLAAIGYALSKRFGTASAPVTVPATGSSADAPPKAVSVDDIPWRTLTDDSPATTETESAPVAEVSEPEPADDPEPESEPVAPVAAEPEDAAGEATAEAQAAAEAELASATTPWVEPTDGTCPLTHPVKAKVASKIFHVPGGLSYARTTPERCYATPDDAEADGFRKAKR